LNTYSKLAHLDTHKVQDLNSQKILPLHVVRRERGFVVIEMGFALLRVHKERDFICKCCSHNIRTRLAGWMNSQRNVKLAQGSWCSLKARHLSLFALTSQPKMGERGEVQSQNFPT